mmetsp:Transcript_94381/g.250697  ORF Transcript_94381/g.250697 Transcript_94381/m.250697 type:complete len:306 (-) Transcript_94381:156-1073(-)
MAPLGESAHMDALRCPTGGSTRSLNSVISSPEEPSSPRRASRGAPQAWLPSRGYFAAEGASGTLLASEDMEFVHVTLTKLDGWCPGLDLRITARDVPIKQQRVLQLLQFIGNVLVSEDAASGFGITYDFRLLKSPSVSGLLSIARWASESSRKRLFLERCASCTACVPPGWKFSATQAAMSAFFAITPPTCRTYLTTDFDLASATVATFDPPEGRSVPGRSGPAATSNGAVSVQQPRPRSCGGCFAWLCRDRKAAALAAAVKRIECLEQESREQQAALEKLRARMAQLEAAVPWADTIAQLGLGG